MRATFFAILSSACIAAAGTQAAASPALQGKGWAQAAAPAPLLQRTQEGGQTFVNPNVNGTIADHCATWAQDCQRGGADAFCRLKGFSGAAAWTEFRPGRTYVIGSKRICPPDGNYASWCIGLKTVTCR